MIRQWLATFIVATLLVGCAVNSDTEQLSAKSESSRRFVETVILGSEYGSSGSVSRFARSPRVSIFSPNSSQRGMVLSAMSQINQAIGRSGIQMHLGADNDRSADVLVYYAPMSSFYSIARENGFEYQPGNTGFFWMFWNGNHEITKSVVLIGTDALSASEIPSVTLEELTQAMGAPNDQSEIQDSIFYETPYNPGFATQLAAMDRNLLDFLYTKLRPGYGAAQVDYVFNRYWQE